MPVTTIGGQEVHVDEEGFLTEYDEWSEDLAKELASNIGIEELNDDHWKVIEFVQGYYRTYGLGPPVVKVHQETRLSSGDICRLFPCGMVKGAYRLSGLPRPPGCS